MLNVNIYVTMNDHEIALECCDNEIVHYVDVMK